MPMSNEALSTLLEAMLARELRPRDVIRQLEASGHLDAAELVFGALGGSGIVEIGHDGMARYTSGRTVEEVDGDWKKRDQVR